MNVSSSLLAWLRISWAWLSEPHPPASGSPLTQRRPPAAEVVLALVMGLLVAGVAELLKEQHGPMLLLMAVGAALLSLARRRLPEPVLVATAALTAIGAGFTPLLVLVGWSAGRRIIGVERALVSFVIAYVVFVGITLASTWGMDTWSQQSAFLSLLVTLSFLATAVFPGLASRYWSQRRTLLHALQERNAQLLWESQMIAGQARLLERQRIAQDMHDSLGHQLALISVHTGALEVDPALTERQRQAVGILRQASVTAMHELREVVGILRDGVEAPAGPVDDAGRAARGTAGVPELVESARAAGNSVGLVHGGEPRPLAPAADHAAYRIVQEALTNAYKHAPGARIDVALRYEPDSLVVEIVSGPARGARGEVVSGGRGLTGLRERARLVGGMVHAGAVDGGGFRVAGVLPYGAGEPSSTGAPARVGAAGPDARPAGVPFTGPGAAVMDWSASPRPYPYLADGLDPRRSQGRGTGLKVGCGVIAAAGLLMVVAATAGMYFLVVAMAQSMIDPSEYERIAVGSSEGTVRDQLPSGGSIVTAGVGDAGPTPPKGAKCLVLMSSELGEGFDAEPVFRFCFRDGKLIEKRAFDANEG
ncbi:histidine kinase [Streptomyces sp. NPDC057638]|uniref:histidine kinase n=1 Tax=Streptomyces sp. NPDC057638 TaxID=3346190 RepID=UPI0036BB88A4